MDAYVAEICKLENKFLGLEIRHIVRDNNVTADVLSKLGSERAKVPAGVFVQELHQPSIKTPDLITTDATREVMMIEVDWREPLVDFIKNENLPRGWILEVQTRGWILEVQTLLDYYEEPKDTLWSEINSTSVEPCQESS